MTTSGPESRSGLVLELAEEFLERYRRGQRPPLREYIERHPDLAAEIREVFPAMAMMEHIALADESLQGDSAGATPLRSISGLDQLGDYRILREVGRGGMGVVYEAEQVSLGRHVALKVLPPQMLRDAKQRRRFEREARAAARLHHTNIVPVFGVGEHDETPYYVMQFIQGQGLDSVLDELKRLRAAGPKPTADAVDATVPVPGDRRDVSAADMARSLLTGRFEPSGPPPNGPCVDPTPAPGSSDALSSSSLSLPGVEGRGKSKRPTYWEGVARVGHQVADGLAYAHAQGIVHRDVKPSNLLLDNRGTAWVADFGLAKAEDQQDLTHTGDLLGTLRYMPPEAFGGRADARGDIYSLGLTLYELLAFRPAFDETDRGRLVRQVTNEEPPRLRKLNPEVPCDLETIVQKAIERDPSHRYASASELADDLRRFADDEPILARRASPPERLARWGRRNPAMAGLSAAVAALLSAVLCGLWYGNLESKKALYRETALRTAAETEKSRATSAMLTAQEAQRDAVAAATQETRSRLRAEAARTELGDELYASRLNLVQNALQAGNLDRGLALLDLERPRTSEPDRRGFEWHYWQRKVHSERSIRWLSGGENASMTPPRLSPDGRLVGTVEPSFSRGQAWFVVRETGSGRERLRIRLDQDAGSLSHRAVVSFDRDGSRIAVAWSAYGQRVNPRADLGVWDLASGKETFRHTVKSPPEEGPGNLWTDAALSGDGRRLAWCESLAGRRDGRTVYFRSRLEIRDLDTGERLLEQPLAAGEGIRDVDLNEEGSLVAYVRTIPKDGSTTFGDAANRLIAYDLPGGRERWDQDVGRGTVYAMAFEPTGRRLALSILPPDRPSVLQVRDAEQGVVSREWTLDKTATRLRFGPDGRLLIASSLSAFQVLDPASDRPPVLTYEGSSSRGGYSIDDALILPGGRVLAVDKGTLKEWAVPDREPASLLAGRTYPGASDVGLSPALSRFARVVQDTPGPERTLMVEDAGTGDIVTRIPLGRDDALFTTRTIHFGANARAVAVTASVMSLADRASASTRTCIWQLPSGRLLADLTPERPGLAWDGRWGGQPVVEISPDGSVIALGVNGSAGSPERGRKLTGQVLLLSAKTGEVVRRLDPLQGASGLLALGEFTPDGRSLAISVQPQSPETPGAAQVWNVAAGRLERTLDLDGPGHPSAVRFSRDGRRAIALVTVWGDEYRRDVMTWTLQSPNKPVRFAWQGREFGGLALSPDGSRLVTFTSSMQDASEVNLWDGLGGRALANWSTGQWRPIEAHFTHDGHRLIVLARRGVGSAMTSRAMVFDASPVDPTVEGFRLVQEVGARVGLNRDVMERIAAQHGRAPDVLKAAAEFAKTRPENPIAVGMDAIHLLDASARPPAESVRKAVELLDHAIRLAPEDPEYPKQRGRALLLIGQQAEALVSLRRSIALDPDAADPHAYLAICKARLGHRAEAEAALAEYRRLWAKSNPAAKGPVPLLEEVEAALREASKAGEGDAAFPSAPGQPGR